jgi:eukaryotic-like serine/threonine-protein kinase
LRIKFAIPKHMRNIFKFITHRPLWVNIVTAILLSIALFAIFLLSLNLLTHHGRSRTVPHVVGKPYAETEAMLEKLGFNIVIQDSIYVDTLPPSTIIKQVPEGDAVVKVNRTIYLTINRAVPPMIDMPNLIGFSFRNAEMNLLSAGLRIGDTSYRSDFAKNSVLEQLYNGQPIAAGTKIQMGSAISLVLGSGVGEQKFSVPDLVGRTYGEAKAMMEANGLNLIPILREPISDTAAAFIVDQDPRRYNDAGEPKYIRTGQIITVFLMLNKLMPIDTTQNNQFP